MRVARPPETRLSQSSTPGGSSALLRDAGIRRGVVVGIVVTLAAGANAQVVSRVTTEYGDRGSKPEHTVEAAAEQDGPGHSRLTTPDGALATSGR